MDQAVVAPPNIAQPRSGFITPRTSSRHTPTNSTGDARPSSAHSRRNRSRAQSATSPPPPLPTTKDGELVGGPPADVMVDLLASFNSISHIKPSRKTDAASAPSPPPFRRSRPGTASAASPPGTPRQKFGDDRSRIQTAPHTPSHSQVPENFPPPPPIPNDEYDYAEPPTVPTTRRSPAHSKQNSFSQSQPVRPKTSSAVSSNRFVSSFSRPEQSPQTPAERPSTRSGYATPQEPETKSSTGRSGFLRSLSRRRARTDPRNPSALSQPASIRGFSAHGSAFNSRPQTPTGETPDVPPRSSARAVKSVPNSHYHTPRKHSPAPPLPLTEPTRTRKLSLSRRLFKEETPKTPVNGKGQSRSRKASDADGIPPMPTSAPPAVPMLDGRPAVPDRGSSLPKKPFGGLHKLKDPLSSMRRSSRKRADAEDSSSPLSSSKTKNRDAEKVALDEDQESDVLRRIRELKEAKERRQREDAELAAADLSGPPKTVTANGQLLAAAKVQEQRVDLQRAKTNGSTEDVAKDVPLMMEPVSNGRAATKSAGQSRSNSRSRTRPSTDLAPPARGHKKTNSRGGYSIGGTSSHYEVDDDSIQEEVQTYLETPRLSQKIRSTRDTSRMISFSEVGDPKGYPVLCCVGMGLTRYVMAFYDELATSLRLRLITPERPGIGDTSPFAGGISYPLQWPGMSLTFIVEKTKYTNERLDDVQDIIDHLSVSKYTLLAHSAGAIFGLAAALSYPDLLRCPIHLLAPWIPPSQMVSPPTSHPKSATNSPKLPVASLPRSQRLLRLLPTPFFKLSSVGGAAGAAANGSATPRTPRRSVDSPRASMARGEGGNAKRLFFSPKPSGRASPTNASPLDEVAFPDDHAMAADVLSASKTNGFADEQKALQAREKHYNEALTSGIWDLSTRNSNPSIDLLICLERSRRIGFNYIDIRHRVIIHHGSKDARVPLENVRWLAAAMPDAELRVLEGQSHSLMSSAGVMGAVLSEISKQCELEARRQRVEAINATIKSVPVPVPHAADLETVDEEGAEFITPPSGTTP